MNLFTHVNAQTVAEAQAALAKGKAQVIAGGTDILCTLRAMCTPTPPSVLINIKTIPNMSYIKEESNTLKIGALTTLAEIAENATVKSKYTALSDAALAAASPELRNTGTIGGNICQRPRCQYYRFEYNEFPCLRKNSSGLCYALLGINTYHSIFGAVGGCIAACPSDIAPALVALNAKIITNKKAAGWTATDFFVPKGEQINAIDADEIVTEIQVPAPAAGTKSSYKKYAFRKAIDFPLVSAAVVATSAGGNVSDVSIVLGGVAGAPRKATAAETSIKSKAIDATSADAAGTAAITGAVTLVNNKYKSQMTKVIVKRAILAVK